MCAQSKPLLCQWNCRKASCLHATCLFLITVWCRLLRLWLASYPAASYKCWFVCFLKRNPTVPKQTWFFSKVVNSIIQQRYPADNHQKSSTENIFWMRNRSRFTISLCCSNFSQMFDTAWERFSWPLHSLCLPALMLLICRQMLLICHVTICLVEMKCGTF